MKFSKKFVKANNNVCTFENHVPAPYMRKTFELDFSPETAEITICGLGFYELYINGKNITKGLLAPYISNTDQLCYYDNYDITDVLNKGKNVIAIHLGNGWRNPFGGFIWGFDKSEHIGPVTAAFCLEAKNSDKEFILEADESIKTHPSPVLFDDLRMGCQYDARLEIDNWNTVGFDDSAWSNVTYEEAPKGEARLCEVEPIVAVEELKPVRIEHFDKLAYAYTDTSPNGKPIERTIRDNVYLFDFGVNAAGVTKLKINGEPGQKITIRHGEHYIDGRFMLNTTFFVADDVIDRYIEYGQKDVYICRGGEEEFIPKFKYDGFQYAYVEGLKPEQVNDDTLTFVVMNSDLKSRAEFECSSPVINQLQKMVRRSDLSNFHYFPTDCPHREKNGWTGDVAVSAEHMLLNLTAEKSLSEWLASVRAVQAADGKLPGIVPTGGWGFAWGNGPAWDRVLIEVAYQVYRFTGDTKVIKDNADAIEKYLKYIWTKRDDKGLIYCGLGDWGDPNWENDEKKIASPLEFTDSVIVMNMAEKAGLLYNAIGMTDRANWSGTLKDAMRDTIRDELVNFDTMTVAGNCQTSQAVAIAFGVFNDDETEEAGKRLVEIIHRSGDINACGKVGIRYIFHVLTQLGETDLAYKIITGTHHHCYGYWVENGASAMWEFFSEITHAWLQSKNHHFLGDISSWFIQQLAGIKPNPNVTDVTEFEISPHFATELQYAKAHYDAKTGRICSHWTRNAEGVELDVKTAEAMHGTIIAPRGYAFTDGTRKIEWRGKNEFRLQLKAN